MRAIDQRIFRLIPHGIKRLDDLLYDVVIAKVQYVRNVLDQDGERPRSTLPGCDSADYSIGFTKVMLYESVLELALEFCQKRRGYARSFQIQANLVERVIG
jgi:hypothetical protein